MTALSEMLRKAQEGNDQGCRGYIAQTPEVIEILGELSKQIMFNIFLDTGDDTFYVQIKTGIHLDKDFE